MFKFVPLLEGNPNPCMQETRCFFFVVGNRVPKILESSYIFNFVIANVNQTFLVLYCVINIEGHSLGFRIVRIVFSSSAELTKIASSSAYSSSVIWVVPRDGALKRYSRGDTSFRIGYSILIPEYRHQMRGLESDL